MTAKPTILVVDDDAGLVDMLTIALEEAGFVVRSASDGKRGLAELERCSPDLVLLDLLMPEVDGIEFCKRVRRTRDTPIVMLTSRDHEMDKVLGLETGADDYVTKPFSTRELVARIRANVRRSTRLADATEVVEVRGLRMDRNRREVSLGRQSIPLTATEFELLWLLCSEPGRVFPRDQLTDDLYAGVSISDRSIDTFVKRLRKKLSECDAQWNEIETVRGVGYRYRG